MATKKALPETEPTEQDEVERKDRLARLDEEIRQVELETKQIQLEQAKRGNQDYVQTKEDRERNAAQAQRNLSIIARNAKAKKDACSHRAGGYGLEDMLNGDGKPCLVTSELPVAGMKIIICPRCLGQWITPSLELKKRDSEAYFEQLAEWKEILKLERQSLSKPMGGPGFSFTNDEGIPVLPELN